MDIQVEGAGNRTAGKTYIEDRSVRAVHHHYYPDTAVRVPESRQQSQFHNSTGIWCPRCAREVFETLMREHGFTAHELGAAWRADVLQWDARGNTVKISVPLAERLFGWVIVFAMAAYFLGLVVPLILVDNRSFGTVAAFVVGSVIYLGTCWMAFRFVLWPHRVALRVGKVIREGGVKCRSCVSSL